jgi:hypothetical protein
MGNGGNSIKDFDPPTHNVVNGAAAADVVAGGLLLVYSELIHNVIGVILIAVGPFLFYWNATRRVYPKSDQ